MDWPHAFGIAPSGESEVRLTESLLDGPSLSDCIEWAMHATQREIGRHALTNTAVRVPMDISMDWRNAVDTHRAFCRRILRLLAIALAATACDKASADRATPSVIADLPGISCSPNEAVDTTRAAPIGEAVTVADVEPACAVELIKVTQFRTTQQEEGLLAGPHVARRTDGVYVTDLFGENALGVWGVDGRFVRRIGRSGRGPGEFANGIQPFFALGDTLYTIDNAHELSVFDRDFNYVRRSRQPAANVPRPSWFVTDDGRRFVSPPPASQRNFHVAELDAEGKVKSLLVPVPPSQTERRYEQIERALAYGGGETFWIGPSLVPEQHYEMEQWSLDGRLLRRVRREASWFVPLREGPPPEPSAPAPTFFAMLQVDSSGYLHTAVSRTKPAPPLPHGVSEPREKRKSRITVRWEIIDPTSGTLIASTEFAGVDSIPLPLIAGTNTSRIMVTDSLDAHVEIVRWRLLSPGNARPSARTSASGVKQQ